MWKPILGALFAAACAPRYGGLEPIQPAQIWTPLPIQHIEVNGVDIAYVDSGGNKPPLVLVHGLSSYLSFWEYQIPYYAQRYRVIALDLPGYGQSGRPDAPYDPPWYAMMVSDWMAAVGVERAPIMAHSMGGQIAMTMALDHSERVESLILAGPAGFERFTPGEAATMKSYWTESRAIHSNETELRTAFTVMVFNRPDQGVERLLQERVRMATTPAFRGTSVAVARSVAGMVDHPVLERLGQIRVPTLIVYGSDDRMIPNPVFHGGRTSHIGEAGASAIPGAELVLLPGAGHTVHHDDADGFHRAADTFLARVGAAQATVTPTAPLGAP